MKTTDKTSILKTLAHTNQGYEGYPTRTGYELRVYAKGTLPYNATQLVFNFDSEENLCSMGVDHLN